MFCIQNRTAALNNYPTCNMHEEKHHSRVTILLAKPEADWFTNMIQNWFVELIRQFWLCIDSTLMFKVLNPNNYIGTRLVQAKQHRLPSRLPHCVGMLPCSPMAKGHGECALQSALKVAPSGTVFFFVGLRPLWCGICKSAFWLNL